MAGFIRDAKWLRFLFRPQRSTGKLQPSEISQDVQLVQQYGNAENVSEIGSYFLRITVAVPALAASAAVFSTGEEEYARILSIAAEQVVIVPTNTEIGLTMQDNVAQNPCAITGRHTFTNAATLQTQRLGTGPQLIVPPRSTVLMKNYLGGGGGSSIRLMFVYLRVPRGTVCGF